MKPNFRGFQDPQAVLCPVKPFPGMDTVVQPPPVQLVLAVLPGKLLRCHAQMLAKGPGKLAVIRKTGFHTHIQHRPPSGSDQLTGRVEAHRVHIFLEGLVGGLLDKMGQVA